MNLVFCAYISIILRSACWASEVMGWREAADLIMKGIEKAYTEGYFTGDLARQMDEEERKQRVKEVLGTQEFADKVVELIKEL